jgi:hypothetical protein
MVAMACKKLDQQELFFQVGFCFINKFFKRLFVILKGGVSAGAGLDSFFAK